jgi:phosphoglucomutase
MTDLETPLTTPLATPLPTPLASLRTRAEAWTRPPFDDETRAAVAALLASDPEGLREAFHRDIDFGTGGMRGIMGVGTNRINRYTLGQASEGLARYVKRQFGAGAGAAGESGAKGVAGAARVAGAAPLRIAIAHDVRHNSEAFTREVAGVFASHGFEVFAFDGFAPTPLLSFAVRELGCQAGIVLTASHNPPAYNGFKVYWDDGAQVVPPHDEGIIEEVRQVRYDEIQFGPPTVTRIGDELFQRYLTRLQGVLLYPDAPEKRDLKVVFTPLHGTTVHLLPRAFEGCGFSAPLVVQEQATPDGDFPTVASPNPEEPEALSQAVAMAQATGADLVVGTDPDGDRIGAAVRVGNDMVLLNGNQTASLLVDYLIRGRAEQGTLPANAFVVSTVVTSELPGAIAAHYGVGYHESLTGFKWIAERIRRHEAHGVFLGGGEESYGFMVGDFLRDKDGIGSAVLLAEAAAMAKPSGGLYAALLRLYEQYGYYHEQLHSLTLQGIVGAERIAEMMRGYRTHPPRTLMGEAVVRVRDFQSLENLDVATGERTAFQFERSNVLQFFTASGSRITVRPSGTEPKIKFYFSLRAPVEGQLTPAGLAGLEAAGRAQVAQAIVDLEAAP